MAARPGPLPDYSNRAAHARAHRVAAERRRRDRRRRRTGREPINRMRYVTLSVRLSPLLDNLAPAMAGFAAAMLKAAHAVQESMRAFTDSLIVSPPPRRALPAPPKSTKDIAGFGPDLVIIDEAYTFTPDWRPQGANP